MKLLDRERLMKAIYAFSGRSKKFRKDKRRKRKKEEDNIKKNKVKTGYSAGSFDEPAYTPNITPSDYYLFRSLQNFIDGNKHINCEGIQMAVEEYFVTKPEEYDKLPERWQTVVTNKGHYILD
ncbi:hypothetical protein TNCV_1626791 [Trichonephila clavipes]|nr:hypothetical protein TNCV_1626791 [Trichonephila clavipes]